LITEEMLSISYVYPLPTFAQSVFRDNPTVLDLARDLCAVDSCKMSRIEDFIRFHDRMNVELRDVRLILEE